MEVILIFVAALFLVVAVIYGLWHNSKRGKPAAGFDSDGNARDSS